MDEVYAQIQQFPFSQYLAIRLDLEIPHPVSIANHKDCHLNLNYQSKYRCKYLDSRLDPTLMIGFSNWTYHSTIVGACKNSSQIKNQKNQKL